MLKTFAAALVAASMLTAPMLAGTSQAATAQTGATTQMPAKASAKVIKKHRKHVRHAARTGTRHATIGRHAKAKAAHVKHARKVTRPVQGTKPVKPAA